MTLEETAIPGVLIIEPKRLEDERGFFARTFDSALFEQRGLAVAFAQQSVAYNRLAGTIRGLHYQIEPDCEEKLVRCVAGALYDVVVDLRRNSASFGSHVALELSAENRRALYVPRGCAHGYQTLADSTEALYDISAAYAPEGARGIAFDDPALAIRWPLPVAVISERDRNLPNLGRAAL